MSIKRMEMIWQPDTVLPYIFGELKSKIEAITPVLQIYLYGSRAKVPVNEWHTLEGKDWDILVVCRFRIINTEIWTKALNYHIDLTVTGTKEPENYVNMVELYPENKLHIPLN